jgi:hypothetical protein
MTSEPPMMQPPSDFADAGNRCEDCQLPWPGLLTVKFNNGTFTLCAPCYVAIQIYAEKQEKLGAK